MPQFAVPSSPGRDQLGVRTTLDDPVVMTTTTSAIAA
ncbi:hypothetical protein ABH922_002363 [Rhodococcus sp. 27YEA15]